MKLLETSSNIDEIKKGKIQGIIIGISLKNSFFSEVNIGRLIEWASTKADNIFIMIPDKPAIHTLMSFGISQEDAIRKARLEANSLENRCKRIIEALEVKNIKIIRWEEIEGISSYNNELLKLKKLFSENVLFKNSIENTTREVVIKNTTQLDENEAIQIGINFVFEELAFIVSSPKIFNLKQIGYLYHSTMIPLKEIIDGEYKEIESTDIGYITATLD